ncbi:hypothetical protein [Streptomyces shaanxiensis]
MAAVGAVEITVDRLDVARACGREWPVPEGLAAELLPVAECVVFAGAHLGADAWPVEWADPDRVRQ